MTKFRTTRYRRIPVIYGIVTNSIQHSNHHTVEIRRPKSDDLENVGFPARFLGDPAHLVAISSRHNRSKGARGPEEWAPPDNALWCQYAQDWAEIKSRWDLTMTEPEAEAVTEMLHTCENPPMVEMEVWVALETETGEQKPTPTKELQSSAYGSCEEAEAAGEQRVQGSQGGG